MFVPVGRTNLPVFYVNHNKSVYLSPCHSPAALSSSLEISLPLNRYLDDSLFRLGLIMQL